VKVIQAAAVAGALAFGASLLLSARSQQQCLHGPAEQAEQQNRRQAGVMFLRQVNNAESASRRSGRYGELSELHIATPPDGFTARVVADQTGYSVSLKDRVDPCHFAMFSDQDGVIFQANPIR
jgi:hypothetical protein